MVCGALEIPFHLPSKCAPQAVAALAALNVSLSAFSEGAHPGRASTGNSLLDDSGFQKSHACTHRGPVCYDGTLHHCD